MEILALFGIIFSILSRECIGTSYDYTKLFHIVPIWLIGVLGYAAIAISSLFQMTTVISHILVVLAFLFTLFLIGWSFVKRILCPMCVIVWMINFLMFAYSLFKLLS